MKKLLLVISVILCSLRINYAQTSINITHANDSDIFYWCGSQPPPVSALFYVSVIIQGYNSTDTFYLRAEFGDGTSQSYLFDVINWNGPGDSVVAVFDHTYLSYGAFDVKYIIQGPDGNADTLFVPDEFIVSDSCAGVIVRTFVDNNLNCNFDAGDSMVVVPINLKNGTANYTNSYGFGWNAAIGFNYTAYVDPIAVQNLGFNLTCPASGFINFNHNGPDTLDFAFNCNATFDLSASSSANKFKIGNSALIETAVSNITCVLQSGSYVVTLDPLMSFVTAYTAPASVVGNTLTWNFTNLGNTSFGGYYPAAYNMFYVNLDPSVQIGDTLCYTMSVTPTVGDFNPSNNSVTLCYPVKSAWDPNHKDVNPKGQGIQGDVLPGTEFTYTIGFQNTGNDTATNVYLIDTLDADLDINTLEILFATHPMQFSIINGNILRFQFDNIMLPDSNVNEMLSHGFVGYKIKHKQGIPDGSQIFNTAYIYFDQNSAVVTNTTLNTIDVALGLPESNAGLISIYPNPVNNILTVNLINDQPREIILSDVLGKEILRKEVSSKEVLLDVNKIPNGVYFLMIREKENKMFQKIVISH